MEHGALDDIRQRHGAATPLLEPEVPLSHHPHGSQHHHYVMDGILWTWSYAGSAVGMQIIVNPMIQFGCDLCWCLSLPGMFAGWGETPGPLLQRLRHEIPAGKLRQWLTYPFFSGPDF
jgi:hypothetical protein